MSDMARKARLALKAKAKSLADEKDQKVDSSDWTQAEPLNADVKTGARPISRRAFKKGGKVTGEKAKANMGRKPRASGGMSPKSYANAKVNRNVKDANEEREGKKHVGGFKKGGRAHREDGGDVMPSPEEKAKTPSQFIVVDPDGVQYGGVYSSRSRANRAMDKRDNEYGAYRYRVKEITPKAKGGRTRREEGGQVDQYDREALKKLIERESTGVKPRGESREVEASDLYTPEQLKRLEAGRKKGGRTKREEGGRTGMRSESTEYAKKSRAADEEYRNAQEKYFKGGMKNWEESGGYEDKHGQYHSRKKGGRAKKKIGGALEFLSPVAMLANAMRDDKDEKKHGGRAKKMGGGAMMMDPRLGMVSGDALPGFNQITPGKKKGGKVKAGASYDEMRSKFGTQVMKKGGKAHGDEAMDKALIKKMVKKSARTGKSNGGGMRSERTELAKASRNVLDRSQDFNEFEAKHGNAFRLGDKRASEYADKAAKYGASQGAYDKTLSETGGMKRGGRTKKADGGRMRSESTESAKANRRVMDAHDEWVRANEAHKNALEKTFKTGDESARIITQGGYGDEYFAKKKRGGRTKRASGGRQSFNSAFAEARKNGMDLFEWNGKLYNTKVAESPRMPANPPMPPRRPGYDIGAGERPMQSGREMGEMLDRMPQRTVTMPQVDAMGTPTGMTNEVQQPEARASSGREEGSVNPVIRNHPAYGWGSRYRGWSERDSSEGARKHGGRAKKAAGGYAEDGNMPNADRGQKKAAKGKGKTNINIVIAAGKPAGQQDMMAPPPGGQVVPQPQMKGPPAPPPAAAGVPVGIPVGMPMGAPPMPPQQPPAAPMARKDGGRITKVAKSYKDMEAGAGSGEGRLQKTDIAKRIPKKKEDGVILTNTRGYPNKVIGATGGRTAHKAGGKVYRSYKDMDAGAGSGEGRLEKAEIQKRKH